MHNHAIYVKNSSVDFPSLLKAPTRSEERIPHEDLSMASKIISEAAVAGRRGHPLPSWPSEMENPDP